MKKILILALVFSILMSSMTLCGYASEGVMAVDGNVTITCETDAPEGTPVAIFILPQILNGTDDVTAQKVAAVKTPAELAALNPEYVAYEKVGADGVLTHTCEMKDSLPTGKCVVVLSYLGKAAYNAGEFEHVSKNDINALLAKFNSPTATALDYDEIIDEDVNGLDGAPAKGILSKSSADIAYYSSLTDKTAFCNMLYSFKPADGGFTLLTLIDKFNETVALLKLSSEADTLLVLNSYNGEGAGKYWNISLGEGSDFASLTSTEQTNILSVIKGAGLTKKEDLPKIFADNLVLAVFREADTREKMESIISISSPYEAYFRGVRTIISNANLGSFETDTMFNNVLAGRKQITSFIGVESLFTASIPQGGGGDNSPSGDRVGATGGLKNNSKDNSTIIPYIPGLGNTFGSFNDVADNHWANEYITRLSKSGVINGVGENNFAPGNKIARQDFVKILVGALGMNLSQTGTSFADVKSGAYYEKYIMTAYEKGLISGISDNKFGIGQNISRQDAAVILSRVLNSKGIAVAPIGAVSFVDTNDIADYAKEAVSTVSAAKIFGGDEKGQFNPKAGLTRAETCAIICRLIDMAKGE